MTKIYLAAFFSMALFAQSAVADEEKVKLEIKIPESIEGSVLEFIPGVTEETDCNNYSMDGSITATAGNEFEFIPDGRSGTKMYCPDVRKTQFIESYNTELVNRRGNTYYFTVPKGYEVRVKVYKQNGDELVFK